MELQSTYRDRAALYDLIYHEKDYAAEAGRLHQMLEGLGVAAGEGILEAACGTGSAMVQLARWYRVAGFDINAGALAVARRKLPGALLWRADMTAFALRRQVGAVLCLFSSLGYLRTAEELLAAARCFHRALVPGGALIVEPWIAPDAFEDGRPHLDTYVDEDLKLARAIVTRAADQLAILDFHWLVARRGEPVEHFVERHELRMFSREELLTAFESTGFEIRWEPDGLIPDRGLLIGRRPS